MHRHPHADMVIIPLSGVVQFRGVPGFPTEVSPGNVLIIPRGNWHEVSNVSAAGQPGPALLHRGRCGRRYRLRGLSEAGSGGPIARVRTMKQSMRIAVIGLGRMGRALAERLLEEGHQVSVWNRTAGRAAALQEQGARVIGSADDIGEECGAVFLCLADDRSTLDVAAPKGGAIELGADPGSQHGDRRSRCVTALAHVYGERFVNARSSGRRRPCARVRPSSSSPARRQAARGCYRCGRRSPERTMSARTRRPQRSSSCCTTRCCWCSWR